MAIPDLTANGVSSGVRMGNYARSKWRSLTARTVLAVLLSHLASMSLTAAAGLASGPWHMLADTVLLAVIATPLIYFFLIRPMIADFAALDAEAMHGRELTRSILETTNEGVVVFDAQGIVTSANAAMGRLLGLNPAQLAGRPAVELLAGDSLGRCECLKFSGDAQAGGHYEANVQRADGTLIPCLINCAVLPEQVRGQHAGACAFVTDISQQKAEAATLQATHDFLRAMIESLPGMFYVISAEGRFMLWNRGFESVSGYDANEIAARSPLDFFTPAQSGHVAAAIATVFEHGTAEVQADFRIRDGSIIPYQFTGMRTQFDGKLCLVGMGIDISERQRTEQAREQARIAAEAANLAKSEFLATMSHEIRTPMNAIIGMTELLAESVQEEEPRMYVETVRRAGGVLLELINDILDLSKIEAGQLDLDHDTFELQVLLDEVLELMGERARDKSVVLAGHLRAGTPCCVKGDVRRLRQVLINLVGNAIKFTHAGEVLITVETAGCARDTDTDTDTEGKLARDDHTVTGDEPLELCFRIVDTGIGIAPEKCALIFEAFTQADSSISRTHGGSGLGLAISQRLVGMMGGRIGVDSEVGRGSTFYFNVKLLRTPCVATCGSGPRLPISAANLFGLRVLVMDDNRSNRIILREMLTTLGAQVSAPERCHDGLELIAQANDSHAPFGLLLLDCRMPGMGGFEVADYIRNTLGCASLPIVMLSSDHGPGDMARARAHGIGYQLKPIRRNELLHAIGHALNGPPAGQETGRPDDRQGTPAAATGNGSPPALSILLAEDNPDNVVLVRAYLKHQPYRIDVAENGATAVALFAAGHYDVVLMDVQMPVLDGHAATRQIRRLEHEQGRVPTPILALTAHALPEHRASSLAAGCNGHLVKPISRATLLEAIIRSTGQAAHPPSQEPVPSP